MELYFSDNYDESSLFLMEVPGTVLDYIKKGEGELIIKGSEPTILCTDSNHFELKFLETSNTYMVIDSEKEESQRKDITLMTYHTLECCEFSPKKYHIYNILKKNCSLNYDLTTGENNFNSFTNRYTKEECFAISDLPLQKFNQLLEEQTIFAYQDRYMCIFNMEFSYDIVGSILRAISYSNKEIFADFQEIFDLLSQTEGQKYDKVVKNMEQSEKKVLLSYVCDIDENEVVSLNIQKAKIFIAKNIFYGNLKSNVEFLLSDFILLFNKAINVYLPVDVVSKLIEEKETYLLNTDCSDNLYDYYKDDDLRFLVGNCIIYISKTRKEPLIKWIELSDLEDTFEKRMVQLFEIKEKWTGKELKLFMNDLEVPNLHEKVGRVTQTVTEQNIFDKSKQLTYFYYKKNPFFKK